MKEITNCKTLAEILEMQAALLEKAVALRELGEIRNVSCDVFLAPYLKTVEVTVDKYEPTQASWKASITETVENGLDYNAADAEALNNYLDWKIAEARAKALDILSRLDPLAEDGGHE